MKCPCENTKRSMPKCDAGTPPVIEINGGECPVLFHTVNIPASVGTVETLPPTPGAYKNARVTYEADNVSYLYDSDGIPQLLSNGGGGGGAVESVNGKTGVVVLDANDVGAQPTLIAGTGITISDNTISATTQTIFYANVSESGNNRHIYKNPDMTGEVSVQELLDANEAGQVVLRMSTSLTPEYFNDAYLQNTYVGNADYQFLFLDNRVYYEYDGTTTADTTYYYSTSNIQLQMSAGTNVQITGNTISATDTTYSNFVGTDGVDDGSAGLVPAPATTDAGKFLKADGTWDTAGGTLYTIYGANEDGAMTQKATTDLVYYGADPKKVNIGDNGKINGNNTIIIGSEDSGTITTAADQIIIGHNITDSGAESIGIGHGAKTAAESVSIGHGSEANLGGVAIGKNAKASNTNAVGINGTATQIDSIAIKGSAEATRAVCIGVDNLANGNNSTAIGGRYTRATASGAVAIGGEYARAMQENSIALGSYAYPRAKGVLDVSHTYGGSTTGGYNNTAYRVISGVHDGEQLHDAATVAQGNTLATSAPTTTTEGVLGQLYTDTTGMHTYQLTAIDTTDPDNPVYTWQQRW